MILSGLAFQRRAEPVGGGQHDPGAPDVLLRAVAVRHDGFEPVMLSGGYFDNEPGAHRTNSHREPQGNPPPDSTVAFNSLGWIV
jgi:hypothetical protein